jgi:hypothetical protein
MARQSTRRPPEGSRCAGAPGGEEDGEVRASHDAVCVDVRDGSLLAPIVDDAVQINAIDEAVGNDIGDALTCIERSISVQIEAR